MYDGLRYHPYYYKCIFIWVFRRLYLDWNELVHSIAYVPAICRMCLCGELFRKKEIIFDKTFFQGFTKQLCSLLHSTFTHMRIQSRKHKDVSCHECSFQKLVRDIQICDMRHDENISLHERLYSLQWRACL